jgi:hypothetical protein
MLHRNFEDLNRTWCAVRDTVLSGNLGATGALCSTLRYHPSQTGPRPQTTGIVKVFTESTDPFDVGKPLIELNVVRHDIKHKLIREANDVISSTSGKDFTSCTTLLYWNDGHPSDVLSSTPTPSPHRWYDATKDKWMLHIVNGLTRDAPHGKWIVPFGSLHGLSHFWHKLKPEVETGNIPAVRMECVDPRTQLDPPAAIHIFTTEDEVKSVGDSVLPIVKRDITYVINGHILGAG